MNIEAEKSGDSICQENDGCPTELAVLQRYWRKRQALTQANMKTDHELLGGIIAEMRESGWTQLKAWADTIEAEVNRLRDVEIPAWKLTAKAFEASYMLSQEENKRLREFIAGIPKASECEPFLASLPPQPLKPTGGL